MRHHQQSEVGTAQIIFQPFGHIKVEVVGRLIDGNREAPVLTSVAGNTVIDPMKLVWSKVKAGEPCNLAEVYRNLLS